ncbi:hypothetical protein ONZ45_g11351 [Pleurotus djamor]|nr:hypothetical protein ONZ45_g11351 [Pleurotus djamor]
MAAITKNTKKRNAASTSNGPALKKRNVEQAKPSKIRRSQRVTVPVEDRPEDSEDEEVVEADSEEGWEDDDMAEDENLVVADNDENAMDVDRKSNIKDPNTVREARKAQKALQDQRKAAKPNSDLLTSAKKVWSLARQRNIPPEERQKHVQNLMNVIRGKVKDIVFKHDASRIVQTVVRNGKQKERDEIAVELKGRYKDLAQNKYSKFLVSKLIRLCPTHRASILTEFQGQVLRLLLHREASSVLADAFELYANSYERTILVREFYGKEATLFTSGNEDKEKARAGLKGVLNASNPEQRKRIMNATKESLFTVFNNSDKGAVSHAIVHRALWEYMTTVNELDDESEREKLRREVFECCQDVLAEMVHTKDGSRVVREFLAFGTAKDRKTVMKALKPHIERICLDEEAQFVVFTALDVIDDTKQVAKTLRFSLKLIQYDRKRVKKEPGVREEEIREAASEELVSWVSKNAEAIAREPGGSLVVAEVMLSATGDKSLATDALLQAISTPYPSADTSEPHIIDLPHGSRLYKTLLQGGHFNHNTKEVNVAPGWDAAPFAEKFVETIGKDNSISMCSDGEANGAFVIAELPPKGAKKKAAAAQSPDGSTTPYTPSLSEQLSYLHEPRPFKNPNYTKNTNRRTKNLKAVLSQEKERERAARERRRQEKEEGMDVDEEAGESTGPKEDNVEEEDLPTYASIEAPPSFLPQRRYCDITGLEAPYTDPATGLRYHDKSVYELIKGLSASSAKDYLSARGVNSIVK